MSDAALVDTEKAGNLSVLFKDLTPTVPAYQPAPDLMERLQALGLEGALRDLVEVGYAVIDDVLPMEDVDRVRAAILAASEDYSKAGQVGNYKGGGSYLLGRDPIFTDAVLAPKILALVELIVGKGALLSQLAATIKGRGNADLVLHADQNWTPAPFPEHTQVVTFCWVTDEFSQEAGATRIVPGSHKHRRHPTPEEAAESKGAVPIKAKKGSVAVWRGETWHGNYPRTIDGDRVVLHASYSRLALRPIEDFSYLGDEWLADKPYEMRVLMGKEDYLGMSQERRIAENYAERIDRTFDWARR